MVSRLDGPTPEVVRRMIEDTRFWNFIASFTDQWLNLDELNRIAINPEYYPKFDSLLKQDMRLETQHFFAEILRRLDTHSAVSPARPHGHDMQPLVVIEEGKDRRLGMPIRQPPLALGFDFPMKSVAGHEGHFVRHVGFGPASRSCLMPAVRSGWASCLERHC